ncbi:hypothetical protein SH2C18_28840 [Clostridium sediminicola]|uniref:DUF1048 domain-containing protein n=1 Tax=Clostridium sediminicola TaxID=3114879 RepID=UPI0031F2341F
MNYQGNNKLFMSIGLTVLLMVTLLILVAAKPGARSVLIIFSGLIIIMAFLGVYFTYKQLAHTKVRIKQLPVSYQSVYLDANELIGTYGIQKGEKQEIMNMILEIFEHASLDNREVEEVINYDLGTFVGGFINETGKVHNGFYLFSYSTSLFIGYLLLMKTYKVVRTGNVSMAMLHSETLDVGLVVTYGLIAYLFFPWLLLTIQRSAKYQWQGIKRIQILFPFVIPLGLMSGLILIDDPAFIKIIDRPIPIFTNIWSVAIGIILLLCSFWMMKSNKK